MLFLFQKSNVEKSSQEKGPLHNSKSAKLFINQSSINQSTNQSINRFNGELVNQSVS